MLTAVPALPNSLSVQPAFRAGQILPAEAAMLRKAPAGTRRLPPAASRAGNKEPPVQRLNMGLLKQVNGFSRASFYQNLMTGRLAGDRSAGVQTAEGRYRTALKIVRRSCPGE